MFSSWWKSSAAKQEETKEKKETNKKTEEYIITPARKWASHKNGIYTPHPSTTATTLTTLTSQASAPVIVLKTKNTKMTVTTNDETKDDDGSDNTNTVPEGKDAINYYQEQLDQASASLQAMLKKYEEAKENVIASDTGLISHNVQTEPVILEQEKKEEPSPFKTFLITAFNKAVEDLEPAHYELNNLIKKKHEEIQKKYKQLQEMNAKAKEQNLTEAEARRLFVDMCNTSTAIIYANIQLIGDIKAEIEWCLRFGRVAEMALTKGAEVLIAFALGKLGLPAIAGLENLNLDFSSYYRNFLNYEITDVKKVIEQYMTDVNGLLEQALKIIQAQLKQWEEKKSNKSDPLPSLKESGKLLLLPKPEQKDKVQDNLQPQPAQTPAPH